MQTDKFRCNILEQFRGKRPNWQSGDWIGDYCNDDANYRNTMMSLRAKNTVGKVIFSGKG